MPPLLTHKRCVRLSCCIAVGLSTACGAANEEVTSSSEERSSDTTTNTEPASVHDTLLRAAAAFQVISGKTPRSDERSFEVIGDDQRFGEVLAAIGTPENGGPLRSADGMVWHPAVDFDQQVVGWVYLGWYSSCRDKVVAANSAESQDGRHRVEVTVGAESCGALAAECYQFAFLTLPRINGTYEVEYEFEPPPCP